MADGRKKKWREPARLAATYGVADLFVPPDAGFEAVYGLILHEKRLRPATGRGLAKAVRGGLMPWQAAET